MNRQTELVFQETVCTALSETACSRIIERKLDYEQPVECLCGNLAARLASLNLSPRQKLWPTRLQAKYPLSTMIVKPLGTL